MYLLVTFFFTFSPFVVGFQLHAFVSTTWAQIPKSLLYLVHNRAKGFFFYFWLTHCWKRATFLHLLSGAQMEYLFR